MIQYMNIEIVKFEDMAPMERHNALTNLAALQARENAMTGKTVGELIESGEWDYEIVSVECQPNRDPYNWKSYVVRREPKKFGNINVELPPELLARKHAAEVVDTTVDEFLKRRKAGEHGV